MLVKILLKKINYNSEDTKFNLILTPKSGQVDVDQINYSYAGLNYDAIFVVDTADKKLMGDWINSFEQEMQNIPLINIDHHADNTRFGTLNLVDDQAAAASMVVHELLMSLQLPLSQNQATNLLAGVLSDTNGFVNRNADANSLNSASQLTANGADLHGLTQALFKSLSLPALHLWGIVLSRAQIEEPGIVITHLTQKDIQQTNARKADEESLGVIVNMYIPAVVGAKVGVVLKEDEEGNIKGSLRSIDPRVNVQAIAKQLNGGGHILASGFKLDNQSMDQARQKVLHSIRQELDKNTSLSEEKGSKASD